MNEKQILQALEEAMEGVEQALMILAAATASQTNGAALLKELLASETRLGLACGENGWRDRFARKMQIGTAQIARRQQITDPALQSLVASVLSPRPDDPAPQDLN